MPSIAIKKLKLLDLISLISNYLGTSFHLYFLYLFTLKSIKISKVSFYFVPLLLLIIVICFRNASSTYLALQSFRYYYGWLIFVLIFLNISEKFPVQNIFKLIIFLTIAEAVLVNTVIEIEWLFNNNIDISNDIGGGYITKYFGFYQRPFGVCGNSSLTSSLIVILISLNKNKIMSIWNLFGLFSILLLMSGTGFVLYISLIFLSMGFLSLLLIPGAILMYITFISPWVETWNWKLSVDGLFALADHKLNNFREVLVTDNIIWGKPMQHSLGFMADIGWTGFFSSFGCILTIIILIALLFTYIKAKQYRKTIVLMFLSGFHYSLLFNFYGHIILGYIIADTIKSCAATKNNSQIIFK